MLLFCHSFIQSVLLQFRFLFLEFHTSVRQNIFLTANVKYTNVQKKTVFIHHGREKRNSTCIFNQIPLTWLTDRVPQYHYCNPDAYQLSFVISHFKAVRREGPCFIMNHGRLKESWQAFLSASEFVKLPGLKCLVSFIKRLRLKPKMTSSGSLVGL